MKCPACEHEVQRGKNYCTFCGWGMVDDVTVYRSLFSAAQLKEYEERLSIYRGVVKRSLRNGNAVPEEDLGNGNAVPEEDLESGMLQRVEDQPFQINSDNQVRVSAERALENAREADRLYGGSNLAHELEADIREYEERTGERRSLIQEICGRIANGTFEGLKIGDYFDVTLSNKETIRLRLAGFGVDLRAVLPDMRHRMRGFVNMLDEQVTNYAFLIPDNCLGNKEPMQKVGLLERPDSLVTKYEDSYIYQKILPEYTEMLQKELGYHMVCMEGRPELELLSHEMLYGNPDHDYGGLPLFIHDPHMREAKPDNKKSADCTYWLRDASGNGFMTSNGEVALPYKKLGVRPYFRIG